MTTPPLWSHQERDIAKYLEKGSLMNCSDPGTGKTRTIIEVIRQRKLPTLILAPKSILQCAWGNDFNTFAPEITYAVAESKNREKMFNTGAQVVITNIDALKWIKDNPSVLKQFEGGFLVIDESTSIKNPSSIRTKAAMAIRGTFRDCTCLSGTPTPQGIIDLWSQMFLVDQGARLGKSHYRFRNLAYTPRNRGMFTEWEEKPGVADVIADIVIDVTIRNRRDDCLDLPEHQVVTRHIALGGKHLEQYTKLKRTAILSLEQGDITAVNAAVLLTKLLQLSSGAVYDETGEAHVLSTDRYELVNDLVNERAHSLVVFNWRHQRDELIKLAKRDGTPYGLIDGSSTGADRTRVVKDFQSGMLKVLYVHPQSAGHGLTLTRGTATIWCSPTYNIEHFEQTNARIYRGGQTEKTETILICADNTFEKEVYASLQTKQVNLKNLLENLV